MSLRYFSSVWPFRLGGGIRLENGGLHLFNCMVESMLGQGSKGAGIYSYNSNLSLQNSTLNYNNADDSLALVQEYILKMMV